MPSTDTFDDQISRPQVSSYYYGYMYSGFLSLQKVTDEYFMSYASSPSSISTLVSSGAPTVTTRVSMGVFPTQPFEANNFQQTISSLLPIFFMLAFLYPFSRFIRGLVLEKEQKIKEVREGEARERCGGHPCMSEGKRRELRRILSHGQLRLMTPQDANTSLRSARRTHYTLTTHYYRA